MVNNDKPFTVESTTRQVIENQLLTALEDKTTVAILATEQDLLMLIGALADWPGPKAQEFKNGLVQLCQAAFGK